MSGDIEAGGLDSLGAFFRRRRPRHTRPPGSPCANCGATLIGAWCHDCGQVAEDFHRSIWRLVMEALEGLTHFDGRFWRTFPGLIRRPGQLTRAYIEGHRTSQIPPLRLFLVVLLLVFFCGAIGSGGHNNFVSINGGGTPAERTLARKKLADAHIQLGNKTDVKDSAWLKSRLQTALNDPERFRLALEAQSERFAFLMLPLATALLSLLFVFQRRFFVFDHTIFALHSLSFQGLLLSIVLLFENLTDWSALLLLAAPLHLYAHMRRFYGTRPAGTVLRMAALGLGSLLGFAAILIGLLWVALSAMGAG